MMHDTEMGFSVGNGDQVAVMLAKELKATDLVFATDVAGVFDADPKVALGASLINELSLSNLGMIASANGTKGDASGAMRGKISALASLESELRGGLRMAVISMMTRGRLSALLRGELVDATMIRP